MTVITGADPGVGNTGHIPPPPNPVVPPCTSDLPFVQRMQKVHEIQGDSAIISMISDERTIIPCLGIIAIVDNNLVSSIMRC